MKKCWCVNNDASFCGDCYTKSYPLTDDDSDLVLNAINAFYQKNVKERGCKETIRDMKKLEKKLWKMKKQAR